MFSVTTLSKTVGALALSMSVTFSAAYAFAHDQVLPDAAGSQEVVLGDGREILAAASGLSVYSFDPDGKGASVCYDDCAAAWPPVVIAATEIVKAPFGVTTRNDGALQLTYDGMPLYTYVGDAAKGDVTGDNIGNVWHLIVLKK